VVLAEEIRPLDEAMPGTRPADNGGGAVGDGHPHTCRIRIKGSAEAVEALLASVKAICREHAGRTPLFVHVLLPEQEVVIRVKELSVSPDSAMVMKVESLLGAGSILVEYAGRA